MATLMDGTSTAQSRSEPKTAADYVRALVSRGQLLESPPPLSRETCFAACPNQAPAAASLLVQFTSQFPFYPTLDATTPDTWSQRIAVAHLPGLPGDLRPERDRQSGVALICYEGVPGYSTADTAFDDALLTSRVTEMVNGSRGVVAGAGGALRRCFELGPAEVTLAEVDPGAALMMDRYFRSLCGATFAKASVSAQAPSMGASLTHPPLNDHVVIGNAFTWIEFKGRQHNGLDFVISDMSSEPIGEQQAGGFVSSMQPIRQALKSGGIFVMPARETDTELGRASNELMRRALAGLYKEVGTHEAFVPSYGAPWAFLWARA